MRARFITKNSVYEVVDDAGSFRWTRTITTEDSGTLRTDAGSASSFHHNGVGSPLCILGPSIDLYNGTRVITTSPIVEIQEAVSVSF